MSMDTDVLEANQIRDLALAHRLVIFPCGTEDLDRAVHTVIHWARDCMISEAPLYGASAIATCTNAYCLETAKRSKLHFFKASIPGVPRDWHVRRMHMPYDAEAQILFISGAHGGMQCHRNGSDRPRQLSVDLKLKRPRFLFLP
jgi:hypothetical protein